MAKFQLGEDNKIIYITGNEGPGKVLTYNGGFADWSTPQTGGAGVWGSIVGTLTNQTDLVAALLANQTYNLTSPSTVTVGGLSSGTVLTGKTVQEILELILAPYIPPTFTSFSISSQSQSLEVGDSVSGVKSFNWSTSNPGNVAVNSVAIRDITNSVLLGSGLANDGSESLNVGTVSYNTPNSNSWRAEATNTQSNLFLSSLFSVNWYYRLFYGTSPNATLNEAGIEALLNNPLQSNKNGTYSFLAGDYKYFAWPDSFGSPVATNGFRDANTNFPISMATSAQDPFYSNTQNGWSYGLVSVTNSFGINTNYRVYRSENILGGSISIIVS